MKKMAIVGGMTLFVALILGGAGVYSYMNGRAEPQGFRSPAPTASEAPKANYSGQVADRRSDPVTQVSLPEDVKMPTEIDIKAPQVPEGLADPMGDKK